MVGKGNAREGQEAGGEAGQGGHGSMQRLSLVGMVLTEVAAFSGADVCL